MMCVCVCDPKINIGHDLTSCLKFGPQYFTAFT